MERAITVNPLGGDTVFAHADIQEIKKHEYDITKFTPRMQEALGMAADGHDRQRRKLVDKPFLSHVFETVLMLAELLGIDVEQVREGSSDENLLCAALLHDAVEDSKGRVVLADISATFGDEVATMVDVATKDPGCSLEEYYDKLRRCEPKRLDGLRVIGADKIHALTCRIAELYEHEENAHTAEHFSLSLSEKLVYYSQILQILEEKLPTADLVVAEYRNLFDMYTQQVEFYRRYGVLL